MNVALVGFTLLIYIPRISYACEAEEWKYNPIEKRYLIRKGLPGSFSQSRYLCEKLGGQLLIIRSAETQNFITKWAQSRGWCGNITRFGLTNTGTRVIRWVDGTVLDGNYQTWLGDITEEFCGSLELCGHPGWRTDSCFEALHFMCEAVVPCASRPVLAVNNGPRLENTTVDINANVRDAEIRCYLRGYSVPVSHVTLTCDRGTINTVSGKKSVTKSFPINMEMHGKRCVCRSARGDDGGGEESQIRISVLTNPRLTVDRMGSRTFTIKEGDDFVLTFDMYANPQPDGYRLTTYNAEVSHVWYNLTIDPYDAAIRSTVKVAMSDMWFGQTGLYVLTIQNGIQKDLEYDFELKIQPAHPSDPQLEPYYVLLSTACVVLSIIFVVFAYKTKDTKLNIEEDVEEEAIPDYDTKLNTIEEDVEEEAIPDYDLDLQYPHDLQLQECVQQTFEEDATPDKAEIPIGKFKSTEIL